jgi:hypothetical protein
MVKQTISSTLFMIVAGLLLVVVASYYARNAWTRNAEEYLHWLRQWRKTSWAHYWLSALPKSFPVWNDRILSILGIVMGIFIFLAGVFSLWLNVFGG